MTSILEQLSQEIAGAAERVGASVVGLGRGWGRGSGVVVAPGLVLTNAHVLRGEEVAIRLRSGDTVAGRVAGFDPDLDVAVIAAETQDAPVITWQPEALEAVHVGTPVFALADPGGRGLRTTLGFVSAPGRSFRGPRGRRVTGMIEHTAALPRGASGGPIVDAQGRLLGLNTVRVEGGLILALPADGGLKGRIESLGRGEAPRRPHLGVAIAASRHGRSQRGLTVRAVQEGSAAARAGIRPGDVLIGAGGRALTQLDDLLDALEAASGPIEVVIIRGAEQLTVSVEL